jgi:hypothetical protein
MPRTKLEKTIALLKRGWQTSLSCAKAGGCYSLSQRVGELRNREVLALDGEFHKVYLSQFEISEKWIDLPSGSRVKAWRIIRDRTNDRFTR